MNTGSVDERMMLANIELAAQSLKKIADALGDLGEIADRLDGIDTRLQDIEAHARPLADELLEVRRAVEKYGN